MTIATMNSRTFARDAAAIKRAAQQGPVIITERGKPALAVLNIEEYYRLTGQTGGPSLLQAMQGLPASEEVELELPERGHGTGTWLDAGDTQYGRFCEYGGDAAQPVVGVSFST